MSGEWDRPFMGEFFQSAFTVSLGMAYESVEMMKSSRKSAEQTWTTIKEMLSIPEDSGEGLQEKAKAVAAVWMEKGAGWMASCQEAGEKFIREDDGSDEDD